MPAKLGVIICIWYRHSKERIKKYSTLNQICLVLIFIFFINNISTVIEQSNELINSEAHILEFVARQSCGSESALLLLKLQAKTKVSDIKTVQFDDRYL